ncbi:hypothetical protein AVEN_44472-1 [Araneus ventricosus]|uniref:Uncharacterized protein n=1 Tax=Araneus ventricosus TaxID=182803 RepID=A0A4Y2P0Q7_ARAVE|nr:hypothetical protein AVEN_44472-1 [Araneus ventricosus]
MVQWNLLKVINEDQVFKCAPDYYGDLLAEVGFKIHFCDQQIVEYVFYDDEEYRTFSEDVWANSFIAGLPPELYDEFMEDTFSTFLRLHPRSKDGHLGYRYYTIKALVEKDVDWEVT